MKLIIFNYSMNPNSLVFSHQRQVAIKLGEKFEETIVLTAESDFGDEIPGIKVIPTNWKHGARVKSAFTFLSISLPILFRNRDAVIFSHMTEVQSLLVSPLCRLIGIKHYLWYAHSHKSVYLAMAMPFISGVISSTEGSCPVRGKKVSLIGQGVQPPVGIAGRKKHYPNPLNWYHISRIDPSKRIELLIEVIHSLRLRGANLTLDVFGIPSSKSMEAYFTKLQHSYEGFIDEGWLRFRGQLLRQDLEGALDRFHGFIHGFQGSLDKTLIEATLNRKLVVTINREYKNEFNLKVNDEGSDTEDLCQQISDFMLLTGMEREDEIERRFDIAYAKHSLDGWIQRLTYVLSDAQEPN